MASLTRRARKSERDTITAAATSGIPVSSLVASAVNVRVTTGIQNVRWGGTEWQHEAWLHFDSCPEFRAGVEITANNLSRARLIGAEVDPLTGEPGSTATSDPNVVAVMSELFGGPAGQGQALSALAEHLEVAGDCWALATPDPDLDMATWEILATTEVTASTGGNIQVEQLNGIPRRVDTDTELLMRIWKKHPRHRWDADAPARALLPVLRELAALTAMVSATVKSRLASAGILWLPEELTLPPTAQQNVGPSQVRSEDSGPAAWLDLLTEAMTAPIKDPDSASAVVPMIAQVKGEMIAKISHMEFGRDLDAEIEPLRQACVKRLAIGLNLPPTVLLGMEDANHWTAWTITEDYAKAYLAPKLELICDALTTFYLRPALRALGVDPSLYAVYFDLSALYPRQISTENAQAAYDEDLLSEVDYMAAMGFSETQIASNQERARRLIIRMVKTGNPITLEELAPMLAALFSIHVAPAATPAAALPAGGGAGAAVADATTVTRAPTPTATGQAPSPAGAKPSTAAPVAA